MTFELEVVTLAVADVDRALAFYTEKVVFTPDIDYRPTPDFRLTQLTPPGSACSIHLVAGAHRVGGLYLVTPDLVAEHAALTARGVPVGPIRHKDKVDWTGGWLPGPHPDRRDHATFADFSDPDGNTWTLQERGFRS